jgi:hypothetical protein
VYNDTVNSLYNCTIVSNISYRGGGVCGVCNFYNSIVYFNTSPNGSNWYDGFGAISFTNSCTAPTTTVWAAGNITEDPKFVSVGSRNFRIHYNSPCFNTGTNYSWMTNGTVSSIDLDYGPRIKYDIVDMGAYEALFVKGTIISLR